MRGYRTPCPGAVANACTDPDMGAPSEMTKRGSKCIMAKEVPECYELQSRFLKIMAEISDARDALMSEISKLEGSCDDTRKSLETSINNDQSLLSSTQTKLGTAMEKEASAGETGRQVSKENQQYNDE